ncbi:coagulation factor 5/8 type domain protein [Actinobacteria bacterium OV450]|nr:coagulation factor 5/8 type domain protein [Actinobacteria bacterium OV450]
MSLEKDDVIVSLVGDSDLAAFGVMWASSSTWDHWPEELRSTWWESAYEAPFPQWIMVDLRSRRTVRRLVLKAPEHVPAQNQTLTVEGSEDGRTFTTLVPSTRYDFTPQTVIDLPGEGAQTRCVRLVFTANDDEGQAFLSGFEVYGNPGDEPDEDSVPLEDPLSEPEPRGRTPLHIGADRSGRVSLVFSGDLSWDGEGGYTITGQLKADSPRDGRRTTVWLEYGGENESWKQSPETQTAYGNGGNLVVRLTGKLARGEKLDVRLGSWQSGAFGIGSTEKTDKVQYVIS